MGKIRRIDYSPDEFLAGTIGLPDADVGIYWRICTLIYSHGGPVATAEVRRVCTSHGNALNAALRRLIGSGKVIDCGDDTLTVRRCENELENAATRSRTASENVGKRWRNGRETVEKRSRNDDEMSSTLGKNNEIADDFVMLTINHQPSTTNKKMPNGILSGNGSARLPDPAVEMTAIWNEECGFISRANQPNASRRGRCARAWRHEFGGSADQWRAYCRKVAASPHLRGENDRGWHADLDWVLKPENVAKIMEGRYERRGPVANGACAGPDQPAPTAQELFGDDYARKVGLAH